MTDTDPTFAVVSILCLNADSEALCRAADAYLLSLGLGLPERRTVFAAALLRIPEIFTEVRWHLYEPDRGMAYRVNT